MLEGVEDDGGQVVPLYQVAEGRATASYATAVAALAGVPQQVVNRASQVDHCLLDNFQSGTCYFFVCL